MSVDTSADGGRRGGLEVRSIDYVPLNERHGKLWHLGPLWFMSNAQIATWEAQDAATDTDGGATGTAGGLYALTGNASVLTSLGPDTIQADAALGVIYAGGPSASILGGSGSLVVVGGAGADTLAGDGGRDLVDYAASKSGVIVNLTDGFTASGGDAAGDRLYGVEDVLGPQLAVCVRPPAHASQPCSAARTSGWLSSPKWSVRPTWSTSAPGNSSRPLPRPYAESGRTRSSPTPVSGSGSSIARSSTGMAKPTASACSAASS